MQRLRKDGSTEGSCVLGSPSASHHRNNGAAPKCLHSPCQRGNAWWWRRAVLHSRALLSQPVCCCVLALSGGCAGGEVSPAETAAPWGGVGMSPISPNKRNVSFSECWDPHQPHPERGSRGRWVWWQQQAAPARHVYAVTSPSATWVGSATWERASPAAERVCCWQLIGVDLKSLRSCQTPLGLPQAPYMGS